MGSPARAAAVILTGKFIIFVMQKENDMGYFSGLFTFVFALMAAIGILIASFYLTGAFICLLESIWDELKSR